MSHNIIQEKTELQYA